LPELGNVLLEGSGHTDQLVPAGGRNICRV